jgi:hypothetical protein
MKQVVTILIMTVTIQTRALITNNLVADWQAAAGTGLWIPASIRPSRRG